MRIWLVPARNSTYTYISLVVALTASFMVSISQGTIITVVADNDTVNGNTTSLSTLVSDPGPDGISLSEAVKVANSDPGQYTVRFDPALKGAVIAITNGIPPIMGGQLVISGDVDGDGVADITLDGGGSAHTGFNIHTSDVTIEGFFISNFRWTGINIGTRREAESIERVILRKNRITVGWSAIVVSNWPQDCVIRDVEITKNILVNNGFAGVNIQPGSGPLSTNNLVSDIRITENLISDGYRIAVFACGAIAEGSTNNAISNLVIARNTISGHTNSTLLIAGGSNPGTQDNVVDSISIVDNVIKGKPVTIEILGGVATNSNRNTVSRVKIAGNILQGGGIHIVGGEGHDADPEFPTSENNVLGISIQRNIISDCPANGISIQGGAFYSKSNNVGNVSILSNLVYGCSDAGIVLLGGWRESPDVAYKDDLGNILNGVRISNNTITENGNDIWAGGIVINSNVYCSGNSVINVEVDSTILWNNKQGDRICDIGESRVVRFSILGDSRYIGKNGNFYDSPQFVDPEDMDYRLQSASPAIDMGNPDTGDIGESDCSGNIRVADGNMDGNPVIDIGAFEFISLSENAFTLDLAKGWNLISLPLLPPDTHPDAVFSSIGTMYNSVWSYESATGWSVCGPGAPSDLQEIVLGKGYWIKMDVSGTLTIQGTIPEQTAIALIGNAWNLVGYGSLKFSNAEGCMSSAANDISSVWEYGPHGAVVKSWSVYAPGGPSDLEVMKPGYGYWIKADQACDWDINAP